MVKDWQMEGNTRTTKIAIDADLALVEEVKRYRAAARLIVRSDRSFAERALSLVDLAREARNEPDDVLSRWAGEAIWIEASAYLGNAEPPEPSQPSDPYEARQRKLRANGYSDCPTCRAPLATVEDFERWRGMRERHRREVEIREQAVQR